MIVNKSNHLYYYASTNAYHNYLCYNLQNDNMDPNLIEEKDRLIISKVSLLATFFASKKEEVIKKVENAEHISKILDEKLVEMIKELAEFDGNSYKLGQLEDNNPANILAFIRNKFGHGDYQIDTDNYEVIFNNGQMKIKVNIQKLYQIAQKSIEAIIKYPKAKEIKRAYIKNKYLPEKKFEKRKEVETYLTTVVLNIYKFKKMDGSLLSLEDEEIINQYYEYLIYKENHSQHNKQKIVMETMEIADKFLLNQLKRNNIQIDIKHPKIKKTDTIEKILKIIDMDDSFYQSPTLDEQIILMSNHVIYNMVDNYYGDDYLDGIMQNLYIIDQMEKTNCFNLHKIAHNVYVDAITAQVSSLISNYNSLFIYPLEDIYCKKANEFDFSKLDLDMIKPSVLIIEKNNLKSLILEITAKIKSLKECRNTKNLITQHLNKAKEKENLKGIEIQKEKLIQINKKEEELKQIIMEKYNKYHEIKKDYRINKKYYENKTKIEYIRHAIFHNNITVKRFECEDMPSNTIINFKDYNDNSELVFDLDITIEDFAKIFKEENLDFIIDFADNKIKLEIENSIFTKTKVFMNKIFNF